MNNVVIEEMSHEDIVEMMDKAEKIAKIAGFESHKAMENFKVDASLGLVGFGGSFARHLGEALAYADSNNTFKILSMFRDECVEHRYLYLKWMENRNQLQNEKSEE